MGKCYERTVRNFELEFHELDKLLGLPPEFHIQAVYVTDTGTRQVVFEAVKFKGEVDRGQES